MRRNLHYIDRIYNKYEEDYSCDKTTANLRNSRSFVPKRPSMHSFDVQVPYDQTTEPRVLSY